MNRVLMGFLAVIVLTACGGRSSADIRGEWRLVSYGPSAGQIPAVPDVDTSIVYDNEGNMSGNLGCNGFGGEYKIDGDSITFGPIMSTMMFCEGPVGEQEMGTLSVLNEQVTFVLDGNQMTITSGDGDSSVVLERK